LLLLSEGLRAEIYLWPLHGPRRISSSFGEYRNGHIHAGLDIRTFGRLGLPCLAVEDGTAVRVKIAPFGYGKALYVRLDDGSTAVYAHVDGFSRAVDSLAYVWRMDHEVSWCDLTIPADLYRFSVGDTVCFTGATGTSAPHLHFEIRDERGRPFNPLESLYRVPDSSPPIVSGFEVVPLSHSSSVNDSPVASLFRFRASGSHSYTLGDTLRLEGLFGVGASLWDEQGYSNYRLAPFEIELSVDGMSIYRMRNGVFDYSQAGEVALEYDIFGDSPVDRYRVLYSKRGRTLEGREGNGLIVSASAESSDAFRLTDGCHRLDIRVRDAAGNASMARCHVLVGERPIIDEARVLSSGEEIIVSARSPGGDPVEATLFESNDGGDAWAQLSLERFGHYLRGVPSADGHSLYRFTVKSAGGMIAERYFAPTGRNSPAGGAYGELLPAISHLGLSVRLESNSVLVGDPSLRASFTAPTDSFPVKRTGPKTHIAVIPESAVKDGEAVILVTGTDYRGAHLEAVKAVRLFVLERGRNHYFRLGDTLRVALVARRLWNRGLCLVDERPMPDAPGSGLVAVSPAFSLDYRVDRISKLGLICDPGGRTGLFRWSEGGGWKCVGVPAMEGGEITLPGPGIYAFFRDGFPPAFDAVAIEESPDGSGFFKPYRYYVSVTETGCGVDPYGARAILNGEWTVCEWDEPRNRLYIPLPASYRAGPATLRVEISDRAGNSSVDEFGFVIQ
jgi:hypothetical protein